MPWCSGILLCVLLRSLNQLSSFTLVQLCSGITCDTGLLLINSSAYSKSLRGCMVGRVWKENNMERLYCACVCVCTRERVERPRKFSKGKLGWLNIWRRSLQRAGVSSPLYSSTSYELCNFVMSDLPCSSKGSTNSVPWIKRCIQMHTATAESLQPQWSHCSHTALF